MQTHHLIKIPVAFLTLTLAAAVLPAQAQEPVGEKFGQGLFQEKVRGFFDHLGLTQAQKARIFSILREQLPVVKPKLEALIVEKRALRETIRAFPVNEAAIRAQHTKAAVIESDLAVIRARTVEKIRPILTPEQIEIIQQGEEQLAARVDAFLNQLGSGFPGQ